MFPSQAIKSHGNAIFDEANTCDQLACRLWYYGFLLWCMNVTLTYNLVVNSREQVMEICCLVKYRNTWSMAKLKYAVGAPWGIGFVYGSYFPFLFEVHEGRCRYVEMSLGLNIFISLLAVATEFMFPIILMVYSYSKILAMLRGKGK